MNIKIEKRIPFGFKGEWGNVYKKFTFEEGDAEQNIVSWQKCEYKDIGQDVQFKYADKELNRQIHFSQEIQNLVSKGEYTLAETTDSYFDHENGIFECVAAVGDIVHVFGRWWLVEKIDERSVFTPSKQNFYYCGLKRISDKIVTG